MMALQYICGVKKYNSSSEMKIFRSHFLLVLCIIYQTFISFSTCNNITEIRCRMERRISLHLDDYKRDTCARCYSYLPDSAFKSKDKRLRYDLYSFMLEDVSNNMSYIADPDNVTEAINETFRSDLFFRKWIQCCKAAVKCCSEMVAEPATSTDSVMCPRTWDGWQCWPDTPAGETAKSLCQEYIFFSSTPITCDGYATKECWSNGSWYINQYDGEWSDYRGCDRRGGVRRHQIFHVSAYGVSIAFLIPALIIFSTYKQLQVHRITMHKNLFAALLLNEVLQIAFKAKFIFDEINHSEEEPTLMEKNGVSCRLLYVMKSYSRMCTYMWMFCEGFYLHKLIASAFAEQKSLYIFYFIGWVFPVFPVAIFAVLKWSFDDKHCWAIQDELYHWVLNSLNLLSLVLNLAFMCNIIRVLVTKLRATHANEPSQFRKAVRATLVLIPLFGLHFFLVIFKPPKDSCSLSDIYAIISNAMDGLQGCLVSLIFCYFNGEVTELMRRSMYRLRLRYSLDVAPTSVTMTSEMSTGRSGRQSSDYGSASATEWRSRKSLQSNFSQRADTELDNLEGLNQVHRSESKKTAETSLVVLEGKSSL